MAAVREATYVVEFALSASSPAKVRGDAFESLARIYLEQQSYTVIQNIRHTGGEVDLLCQHDLSSRIVVAECKSQRDLVQSAAIDSLYTDVDIHQAHEGWLITVSALGREAKGKLHAIQARYPAKFVHIDATVLVRHCIKAGALASPQPILSGNENISEEITLVLTEKERFFCFEHRSHDRQVIEGYTLVRADDLRSVRTQSVLTSVSERLDRYAEARWVNLRHVSNEEPTDGGLIQPVVELAAGLDWRDYRPSRPEDFIGRSAAVDDLKAFIELVRTDQTNTRLFGVKARSGWGKSSLILKTADEVNRLSPQCHFVAVDCRAAVSSDYGQLAISHALAKARHRGTEFWGLPSTIPASSSPFESPEVKNGLQAVANSRALIIVVFDQFEEIIHSANKALFAKLENLCYQVDSQRLPILLGFSWRTDAMVSADNPGYGLWHKLADRRHDVELKAFTSTDARTYLERTERNAGAKLAPKDRRFLLDNYVGLPWLLKKLTINILTARLVPETADDGADGTAAIARLFERDLQELSSEEHACLRSVGEDSPKPLHVLNLEFPGELVTGLIEKRLLINAGGQLSLYSDIFRDYLLYKRLPFIPNTHCPSISAQKLALAIGLVCRRRQVTYAQLAQSLRIAESSADNVARDLQQMSIVKLQRAAGRITSCVSSSVEATVRLVKFLRDHIILDPLLKAPEDEGMEFADIVANAVRAFRFSELSPRTIEQYCSQIVRLSTAVGLIEKSATRFFLSRPIRDVLAEKLRSVRVNQRADGFMAQAPPQSVLEALEQIRTGYGSFAFLRSIGLRNAVFAATSLGLVERQGDAVRIIFDTHTEEELYKKAGENQFVAFVRDLLASHPDTSGPEIGLKLAEEYGLNLHPSSLRRYGSALKRWAVDRPQARCPA